MIITFRTAHMTSTGEIRCRACNSEALKVNAGSLLTITRLRKVTRIINLRPHALVHDCTKPFMWVCPACNATDSLFQVKHRAAVPTWMCRRCLVQARLTSVDMQT